jgi:hypothetical protein
MLADRNVAARAPTVEVEPPMAPPAEDAEGEAEPEADAEAAAEADAPIDDETEGEIALASPSLAWTDAAYEIELDAQSRGDVPAEPAIDLDVEEPRLASEHESEPVVAAAADQEPAAEAIAEVDWSDGSMASAEVAPAEIGSTSQASAASAAACEWTTEPEPEPEPAPEPEPEHEHEHEHEPPPTPLPAPHAVPYRTVEALLDEFGDQNGGRGRALLDAARSLKHLAQVATPTPPAIEFDRLDAELAPPASPVAGLTVGLESTDLGSIPPPSLEPKPLRRPRATLWTSAALLALGVASVGTLWVKKPELFVGRDSPLARAPWVGEQQNVPPAAPAERAATVTLRDLPSAHEVLLRMGVAPMQTPRVPSATRLEFVATAPGHRAERIVVPIEATWSTDTGGQRHLALRTELEPGPTTEWPLAPMGTSGGAGPAGRIEFAATPPGTEIWLVLHAGSEPVVEVPVAVGDGAHLMVVDLRRPETPCRLTLGAAELRAAAEQDGLATSCPLGGE